MQATCAGNEVLGVGSSKTDSGIKAVRKEFIFLVFTSDVIQLQKIMLLLLAERLYTDLVEPALHNLGKLEYCLKVTTELLGDFVSTLYLRNLPHLQERQKKVCHL